MNFSRLTIVKLIELVLACVIVWLHSEAFEGKQIQLLIITGTYCGFCIIVIGTFLGHVFGHPVNRTMDMFFCVVGAVLYIASGSMAISYFRDWTFKSRSENYGLTAGSLAIVQGALFILDAFFVFRIE